MAFINIDFFSEALGRCEMCNVVLPKETYLGNAKTAPVLWLLHGAYGDYSSWVRRSGIERYADERGLAVVMPSAEMSFYADMAHGGRFYTYITEELPEIMRGFFPFSEKREENMIAGLSMGGMGALMLGLANPEKYSVIGVLSAGASLETPNSALEKYMPLVYDDLPVKGTYKDIYGSAQRIINENLPCPRIYHACGRQDFLRERAMETKAFFEKMPDNPFDYTFDEADGTHSWDFWDEHIRHFLKFADMHI